MPLEKQVKQFFFGEGVNTKGSAESLPLGKLHILQNARLDRTGVIQKRYGRAAMSLSTAFSGRGASIPTLKKLMALNDGLFAIGSDTNGVSDRLLNYSSAMSAWPDLTGNASVNGAFSTVTDSVIVNSYPIGSPSSVAIINCDMAIGNNMLCVVSGSGDNTAYAQTNVSLIDLATYEVVFSYVMFQQAIQARVIYSSTANKFYVLAVQQLFPASTNTILAYDIIDPVALSVSFYPTASGQKISTSAYINSNNANSFFDVIVNPTSGTDIIYVALKTAVATTTIWQISALLAAGPTVTNTVTNALAPTNCLSLFYQGTRIGVLSGSAAAVAGASYSQTLGGAVAAFNISTTVTPYNAYGVNTSAAGAGMIYIGDTATLKVNTYTWDITGNTASAATPSPYRYRMASRPFTYNTVNYIWIAYGPNSEQISYLLYGGTSTANNIAVRSFYGSAKLFQDSKGATTSQPRVPSVVFSGNKAILPAIGIQYNPGDGSQLTSLNVVELDFDSPLAYQGVTVNGLRLCCGGVMKFFDGNEFYPAGFPFFPEAPSLTQSGGGALTLTGVYSYVLVLERIDSRGNVWRSAPSPATQITLTGANATVTIAAVTETMLPADGYFRVFRTQNGGTTYNTVGTFNGATTFVDVLADTDTAAFALLYTTGGVLDNDCLDSVRAITTWKNRVVVLSDRKIFVSKILQADAAIEFSLFLEIPIEPVGGRITGIAALLDKLIVFKKDRIYYVTGDGPNDAGSGSTFSISQILEGTMGCLSQNSIVEFGSSVLFQARNQYWMLSGDLSLSPIGQEIANFLSESTVIKSTCLVDRDNEAKIATTTDVFTFNNYTKQWGRDPAGLISMTYVQGKFTALNTSGVPFQEDTTTYKDGSTAIEMRVATGWIQFGMFQGFQRVYHAYLLARFFTNHTLNVNVYYDYLPKVVDTFTFAASSANLATFTDSNLFTSTPYAGSGDPYSVRLDFTRQKCEAIRLEIFDSAQVGTCRSLDLIGLAIEIGVKNQGAKKPSARVI